MEHEHLARIREQTTTYTPGGIEHLILEVLAYAADEAESAGRAGRGIVTLHADGSASLADDGRGTDSRVDAAGRVIKKPVMATKDLRFFDDPDAATLPDGHTRRGMSVVAALSESADPHQPAHGRVMNSAVWQGRANDRSGSHRWRRDELALRCTSNLTCRS
jgi:DNA gyrase subunit B